MKQSFQFNEADHLPALPKRSGAAFSLMELLVVITVIGVMAAVMIPALSGSMRKNAYDSVYKRNAQAVASLSMAATAAGESPVTNGDVKATIRKFVAGVTAVNGGSRLNFSFSIAEGADMDGTAFFLEAIDGKLVYHPERSTP